jgi:hypothetical protein
MLARNAMMARVLPKLQAVLDPFMMHTFTEIITIICHKIIPAITLLTKGYGSGDPD